MWAFLTKNCHFKSVFEWFVNQCKVSVRNIYHLMYFVNFSFIFGKILVKNLHKNPPKLHKNLKFIMSKSVHCFRSIDMFIAVSWRILGNFWLIFGLNILEKFLKFMKIIHWFTNALKKQKTLYNSKNWK